MATQQQWRWPINDDLSLLRRCVREHAAAAGLEAQRVGELVLAVYEAVANVLDHGGGTGTVSISRDSGHLIVDVVDRRGALDAAHLPFAPPDPRAGRGAGLWVIGQVCDQVSVERQPGGSRIRMAMQLPLP
ncbi:ATP-binding protein [Planomonospora sp. ID91781]|uniref:Anti-sigma regulatory factor, serine/threonine protein kinase n=1 Tax=Planomonospora sphaerica TaxID=161355 RepID=A0A161LHT6_9ACTN|nr:MULTISPECIES: ATP-binding protein [Planomonospora]MBG0823628.1 ATP-binding protein [Planomonospora sp. ID91781]GAT67324.1 anti-sigma regulatory factor, serine/threonine protein kinase [Planomonospora sphaerica]